MLDITYEVFCHDCKLVNSDDAKARIESVENLKDVNTYCVINCEGNRTRLPLRTVVEDVCLNCMGVITNPSKIKTWKGFKR